MKIGELAGKAGCQTVTVRYYEKEGLLKKPERTHSNYRMYTKVDLDRLCFILHCRQHGMSLEAVRALLVFRDNQPSDCTVVGAVLEAHIASVEQQIASLLALKEGLLKLQNACSGIREGQECGIIQNLNDKEHCCG